MSAVRPHHQTGTAPRARGRLPRTERLPVWVRNSPACAGTTPGSTGQSAGRREQPRVRGDDRRGRPAPDGHSGTAPRARGRPEAPSTSSAGPRNSPACAGTTTAPVGRHVARQEQPRVRGDDDARMSASASSEGTAPRARGRRAAKYRARNRSRNSPACAGTTRRTTVTRRPSAEQPRVRGDDTDERQAHHMGWGTAPRARGRPLEFGPHPLRGGGTAPRARGRHFLTCGVTSDRASFHSLLPASAPRHAGPPQYEPPAESHGHRDRLPGSSQQRPVVLLEASLLPSPHVLAELEPHHPRPSGCGTWDNTSQGGEFRLSALNYP